MTACHNINDIAPEILSGCTENNIIPISLKEWIDILFFLFLKY